MSYIQYILYWCLINSKWVILRIRRRYLKVVWILFRERGSTVRAYFRYFDTARTIGPFFVRDTTKHDGCG
jgi:hypothetical protein